MSTRQKYWRINNNIHAPKVRVIDGSGKQVGVVTNTKAQELARKEELDLVEIAPNAKPPVVKIVDYGKFRYRERKKQKLEKKGSKAGELKEVRFSPFIGEADYNTRIARIREFLGEKQKVRVVVKFKGRQMGSKQFGYDLLKKILGEFGDEVKIDMEPKFLGRHLIMTMSPTGKAMAKKNLDKENKNAKTKNKKVSNKKVQSNKKGESPKKTGV